MSQQLLWQGDEMKLRKYQLPDFLIGTVDQIAYQRWLDRKAAAHRRRDRKRGDSDATIEDYKVAIHQAVVRSQGLDFYTAEKLRWDQISTYDNESSKLGRRKYKASLALLPSVDHVGDGLGPADFQICAWRTNDAKNDLSHDEFVELCRRVVQHYDGGSKDMMRDGSQ